MIGILTEIIGNPTPMRNPAGRRQAACRRAIGRCPSRRSDWHYRQSIDYEMTQQPRHARPGLALSRDLAVQHLAHGHELHRAGQQGLLDRHAQAHRGAGSRRGGAGRRRRGGGRGGRGGRGGARGGDAAGGRRRPGGGGTFGGMRAPFPRSCTTRSCTIPKCAIRAATSCPPTRPISPPPPSSSTRCSRTASPS